MKQIIKKCLSIFLSALMLINYVSGSIFAGEYTLDSMATVLNTIQKGDNAELKETVIKLMLEHSNNARSDLTGEISAIDRRIKDLQGYISEEGFYTKIQIEELKSILEDYRCFLINLEDSEEVLAKIELQKFNTFDLLVGKYTEIPYSKIALDKYYKERISRIKNVSVRLSRNLSPEGHKTLIRTPSDINPNMLVNVSQKIKYNEQNIMLLDKALENLGADPNTPIRNMYAREIKIIFTRLTEAQGELESEFAESVKLAEDVVEGLKEKAKQVLDFSNTRSKTNFFENLSKGIIDALEDKEVGSSDEFLKTLFVHSEDTLEQATRKLNLLYIRLVNKVSKDASAHLSKMIQFLRCLRTEQQFKEFMAANKRLTPTYKEIIEQMQDFANREEIKYLLELQGHIINGEYEKLYMEILSERAARQAARKANAVKFIGNSLSGLAMGLTALFVVNMIVKVDANGNSFAYSIDPVNIKYKMENGTATDIEKYAFYMHPSSSKYIIEDPLQFASVILPLMEAATNPVYKEIMNNSAIKFTCSCSTEKAALEKQLDNILKNMEVSRSVNIELPQI